ncbi:MAG: polysaccharide deacetylase family protein [Alicyclobacillus macrosporangiidus]|uniref:polysaccharide deacetylase family protein n=1 Tax=Alicyclobacillus macrosporangiidus TaxID=392015 RepID=UPI0026EC2970|nr:polysaccharide deacetylase family protein [Alicyclobacillus macrosporangiidus]MCL6600586.1 polysaccharide deacetylase family protein [Alicyclobacillus macrosporangiidus]
MRGWWLVVLVVVVVALGYAVLPNVWTRVLKRTALRRVPAAGRRMALTFDDGPDPKYTPRLLDALAQCGVRATFFVIAEKALRHPDIVERMIREGHEVQVHGMRHVLVPVLPPGSAWDQAFTAAEKLQERFGLSIRWYRPTWGLCNLPALWWTWGGRRGLRMVTWSIMVGDWRRTAPGVLRDRILRRLHPGAILVLHDSDETWGSEAGAPERVIELMPELAAALELRGYRLGPLRDLLAAGGLPQPETADSPGAASGPPRAQW